VQHEQTPPDDDPERSRTLERWGFVGDLLSVSFEGLIWVVMLPFRILGWMLLALAEIVS
jgi:hypothetical protein